MRKLISAKITLSKTEIFVSVWNSTYSCRDRCGFKSYYTQTSRYCKSPLNLNSNASEENTLGHWVKMSKNIICYIIACLQKDTNSETWSIFVDNAFCWSEECLWYAYLIITYIWCYVWDILYNYIMVFTAFLMIIQKKIGLWQTFHSFML